MKKYIKSTEDYPSLKAEFPVKIRPHSESNSDQNVQVKLSYKTALLYIDGNNVCSMYPTPKDPIDFWARELKEQCLDYGQPISNDRATELAKYMVENIRG